MKTFIKIAEIWVLNNQRTQLELANAFYYDEFEAFKETSQTIKFSYQKGLPGTVWATGQPVVINDLENSLFERTKEAHQAGLSCAIGMPVMAGEFLMAVIVFLCGDNEDHAGAIEVWANDPDRSCELGVVAGYYGTLDYFEFISRKTKIMKGFGLPGKVWQKGTPILDHDLGESTSFIRGKDAREAGISTGLAIPVHMGAAQIYIMVFLSAKKTPIAKGLQIWVPDDAHEKLYCQTFYNAENDDAVNTFSAQQYAKGETIIGQVWLTGVPFIGDMPLQKSKDAHTAKKLLAMPVIDKGKLNAIVTFLF